jgi:DNA repair exonuclease SbcCD ATPase subunit
MKFPYLLLENFMGYGHAEVSLDDKGLVLIQGVNNGDTSASSNGAGKSTLPDGLAWCFYGATRKVQSKSLEADAVVNRTVGKNTYVKAHAVEDDGSYYVVERWRKKRYKGKQNGCALTYHAVDGTVTDLTKGKDSLTQVEIDKALGAPEDVFMAAIYAAQENLPDLPAMTDTKLKELIEEASGVTTLVRAYEIARKKLGDIQREQDTWRLEHVRTENDVRGIQARITDLTTRQTGFEGKRKTEVASINADFIQARDRARRAKTKRDDIDPVSVQAKMDKLDLEIDAVHEQNEQESELNLVLAEATSKLTTANTIYTQLVGSAQRIKADLESIKSRVGTPCSDCGKPYCEDDIGQAKELATEKLRIEVTKAREMQQDVKELQKVEQDARSALETFKATKTDVRSTVEERARLARLLVDRTAAERELDRDLKEAQRLAQALKDKQAEENPFGPLVDKANEELADTLDAFQKSEVEGVELEKRIQVAKEVVKVYGPRGVRAHVLDTVTPYLNSRTAEYLGQMSDGTINAIWSTIQLNAAGDPVEKFAISVDKPGDADSFIGLSGGEKRKVRLSCALALQDLVASRATKPIELWIGDEIDYALDDAGLERLMNVLENKARERGTVIVISHASLRDWIRETATVTRKNGLSTIEGALDYVAPALAVAA